MSGNVMKTRRPEPAEVEYKQMRFLIMDRPTDATIDRFIEVRPNKILDAVKQP